MLKMGVKIILKLFQTISFVRQHLTLFLFQIGSKYPDNFVIIDRPLKL